MVKCKIKENISDEYLIDHYGFKKVSWNGHHNLEITDDEYGLGLSIFWKDRSVQIVLGEHSEYGCCRIPKTLIKLMNDDLLITYEEEE